jgi:membrane-associated PAP2 superfamily phosphatase
VTVARYRFLLYHGLLPLLAFAATAWLLEITPIDAMLADWLYQLQGGEWRFKDHWLTQNILHDGGLYLIEALYSSVLIGFGLSFVYTPLRRYRYGLLWLFITLILCPVVVSALKHLTHVDCPWDLARYGGLRPYIRTFEAHPGTFPYGQCFPSSHASSAFAFVALYFFAYRYHPRYRWLGLGTGIVMGALYGFDQQLRGAHFLSHDVWALAVCWFIALASYVVFAETPAGGRRYTIGPEGS